MLALHKGIDCFVVQVRIVNWFDQWYALSETSPSAIIFPSIQSTHWGQKLYNFKKHYLILKMKCVKREGRKMYTVAAHLRAAAPMETQNIFYKGHSK